jgi:hypothetical protein
MSGALKHQPYKTLERDHKKKLYHREHDKIATSVQPDSSVVSSNPPEIIPIESSKPIEVFPSKKFKKHHKKIGRKPIHSVPVTERDMESMDRIQPDKHLGTDMLYYPESPATNPANEMEADPNIDFVLIN